MVAAGADDADQPVLDLDHRDVERAAAEVVDEDDLVVPLFEPVGDRRGRRLVEDGADVQARQPAGVGRGLALVGPEVGGAGDDDVGDLLFAAERKLGVADDFPEDERADVLGAEDLALVLEGELRVAHVLLDPGDDAVGLDLGGLLGGVADDDAVAVEEDDRGRDPLALGIRHDHGLAVLVDVGDGRISRPQVDPEHAFEAVAHGSLSLWVSKPGPTGSSLGGPGYSIGSADRRRLGPNLAGTSPRARVGPASDAGGDDATAGPVPGDRSS